MHFGVEDRRVRHAKQQLTSANIEFTRVYHMMTRAPEGQKQALRRQAEIAERKLREAEALVERLVASTKKDGAS